MTDTRSTASRIRGGLGWSTTSNLVLRIGNFCVSIIMARIIAPEQFGVFAVALTVYAILGTLAEFGLGSDLVRSTDFERRAPTVASLGLITSGMLGLTMALSASLLADAFDAPGATDTIRLMSVTLLVFGFSIVPSARLQRDYRQRALFAINATALVLSTGVLTALALLGLGPLALAVGQIVSQTVMVVGQFIATKRPLRLGFDKQIARESAAFCLPLALANLVSWLLLSVDNLVVARVLGPTLLGLYALAFNVSSWPMNAVGQAIRVVALPAFAQLADHRSRSTAMARAVGTVWAVSLLLGVTLAVFATPAIELLYGSRWRGAAVALIGLGAFGGIRVVFDLMVTYLIAAGNTRTVLAIQAIWLAVMVPAMYVGVRTFGLSGAGWTHAAVAVGIVLPAYLVALRRADVSVAALLRGCLLPTLAVIPYVVVGIGIVKYSPSPPLAILFGGIAAVMLYVLPLSRWWLRRVRSLRPTTTAQSTSPST
ncbi:MAG: oligosaccharide flippase family protein [Microlunatus sp.]